MGRAVYEIRRARKEHGCTERSCRIKAGDRYLYTVCPPEHEMNSTRPGDKRRYVVAKTCLRCAERYGLLNDELRAQVEITVMPQGG